MPRGKLTAKQEAFVREYLVDLNATQAAIRAGYSERTAYRTGADNLRKPQVAEAIAEAQQKRAEKLEVTAEEVLTNLRLIATGEASFEERNGLGILVTNRPRFQDRLRAWELLGKHLGMFVERVDHTTKGERLPVAINVYLPDNGRESEAGE